jgi:activator-of-BECN1-regulated-autophagy protein 1
LSPPARSGDHTVKLICSRTGVCVRTLTGHRRTPWVVRRGGRAATPFLARTHVRSPLFFVRCASRRAAPRRPQVRFHPRNSALLASGSLDCEVRVWDAVRGVCLAACEYGARTHKRSSVDAFCRRLTRTR